MLESRSPDLLSGAIDIVTALIVRHPVPSDEVPRLIADIYAALVKLGAQPTAAAAVVQPTVSVGAAVKRHRTAPRRERALRVEIAKAPATKPAEPSQLPPPAPPAPAAPLVTDDLTPAPVPTIGVDTPPSRTRRPILRPVFNSVVPGQNCPGFLERSLRERSESTLPSDARAGPEEWHPVGAEDLLRWSIGEQRCVSAIYNKRLVTLAPHLLFMRNAELFLHAVTVDQAGQPPRELKLGTFKLIGLHGLAPSRQKFARHPDFIVRDVDREKVLCALE